MSFSASRTTSVHASSGRSPRREHTVISSENAEYHAAREQQGFVEARIADIEGKLSHAEVIDIAAVNARGKVVFGATVELMNVSTEEVAVYQIVGEDEADIKSGLVSIRSPVARALITKEAGEIIVVDAPGGRLETRSSTCVTSDAIVDQPTAILL